jgi:hypothetical protein
VKESDLMRSIMLALFGAGCTVWRNNTGCLLDKRGVPVKFGLCVGSSDLIGISPSGKFIAVEIKTTKGRATPEQMRFIEAVREKGGIAGIARSPEEAVALLSK